MVRMMVMGVLVALASLFANGGTDDVFLSFATTGPDRYADNSVVRDGECYALVCTKPDHVFGGFNADGSLCLPENDEVAVVAPSALGGHCRRVVFALPRKFYQTHLNDRWSVQLLDTRDASGRPAELSDTGFPARVNGFGRVEGEIALGRGMVAFAGVMDPVSVGTSSALPADRVPQPVITGIEVQDGRAYISVANTVPFVTYDVAGAAAPNAFGAKPRRVARNRRDGETGRTITLEVDADAATGFFKIVRAE